MIQVGHNISLTPGDVRQCPVYLGRHCGNIKTSVCIYPSFCLTVTSWCSVEAAERFIKYGGPKYVDEIVIKEIREVWDIHVSVVKKKSFCY